MSGLPYTLAEIMFRYFIVQLHNPLNHKMTAEKFMRAMCRALAAQHLRNERTLVEKNNSVFAINQINKKYKCEQAE